MSNLTFNTVQLSKKVKQTTLKCERKYFRNGVHIFLQKESATLQVCNYRNTIGVQRELHSRTGTRRRGVPSPRVAPKRNIRTKYPGIVPVRTVARTTCMYLLPVRHSRQNIHTDYGIPLGGVVSSTAALSEPVMKK